MPNLLSAANRLSAVKDVARNPYAWPGGYPRFLVMSDGDSLCYKCVKSEFRQIAGAVIRRENGTGWTPESDSINWEDPDLICGHCGQPIESAYA